MFNPFSGLSRLVRCVRGILPDLATRWRVRPRTGDSGTQGPVTAPVNKRRVTQTHIRLATCSALIYERSPADVDLWSEADAGQPPRAVWWPGTDRGEVDPERATSWNAGTARNHLAVAQAPALSLVGPQSPRCHWLSLHWVRSSGAGESATVEAWPVLRPEVVSCSQVVSNPLAIASLGRDLNTGLWPPWLGWPWKWKGGADFGKGSTVRRGGGEGGVTVMAVQALIVASLLLAHAVRAGENHSWQTVSVDTFDQGAADI